MKYVAVLLAALAIAGCKKGIPGLSSSSLSNDRDSTSYALGMNIGKQIHADSIDINPEMFVRGMTDAASDSGKKMLTDQEVQMSLMRLNQAISAKRAAAASLVAEKNKMEGEACLEQNKKREGVCTLPSGLQYLVIKEGTGPMPKKGQTVETRYRGTLVDGSEFDNSERHGGTVTFPVDRVIPGWSEALLKMKVGSKWKVWVPSQLAYGPQGAGGMIGPNCALIFELELVAIK